MFPFFLKRKKIIGLFIAFIFIFGIYGTMKVDKKMFSPIDLDQALKDGDRGTGEQAEITEKVRFSRK